MHNKLRKSGTCSKNCNNFNPSRANGVLARIKWNLSLSLSEMCIHSLEGAHALVSHPSPPPPAPPLPLERDCHCLVFLLCLTRYLLSFKKAKTCLHQLNSLAHTDLKLTAISSSHSPFERIVLRRPSFWGSIGRKRLIYQHLIKPTCKRSATDLQTRIIKEGRTFQYSALCHMNA